MTQSEEWDDDYETCERWSDSTDPFMAEVLEFSYNGRYPVPGHRLNVRVPTTNGLEESDDGRMCWMVSCDAGSLEMHTSIRAARRLARFILDNTKDKKQVPDGPSDHDPCPGEGKPGKREDGAKEGHTEVNEGSMGATREDKEAVEARRKLKEVEKKVVESIDLITEAQGIYDSIGDRFMSMECTNIRGPFLALTKVMKNANRKALEE